MADSANPVSPKTVWAGIGGAVGAVVAPILVELINQVNQLPNISDTWRLILTAIATILGAVIAAYAKKDGLRLPTLDQAEVAKLPDAVDPIP